MENSTAKALAMGRVCKRGHKVTGTNALVKQIAGKEYLQCRICKNLAEVERRKFYREQEARRPYQKEYRHVVLNTV